MWKRAHLGGYSVPWCPRALAMMTAGEIEGATPHQHGCGGHGE